MKDKFRYVIFGLVFMFLVFALFFSRYSELTFIYHSYLFALILLSIFIVFAMWQILSNEKVNKETFNPVAWLPIIAFLILIFTSQVRYDSIEETYRIIVPLSLFLVMINVIRNESDRKLSVYLLLGAGFIFTLYNYLVFYFSPFSDMSALTSNWGYHNTFAAFLVLIIQISLGVYFDEKRRTIKMFLSILPMFFIFVLFLTVSRGGYIAFFVSIIAFLILNSREEIVKLIKEFTPVLIGAFSLIVFGAPREIILANLGKSTILVNYIGGAQDQSLGMRIYMAQVAAKIFLEKPIFGYGLGGFRYTFAIHNIKDISGRIDPHSLFFKLLSETGIIGTISYFAFSLYYLLKSFSNAKNIKLSNFYYRGLLAGVIGMFFHMCIDVDVYPVMFVILMISLGILVESEFVEMRMSKRIILSLISVILIVLVFTNLVPKTIGGFWAVLSETPQSISTVQTNIDYINKAIIYDPDSPYYYFTLGSLIQASMKSFDEYKIEQAKLAYKKAFELNNYYSDPALRLGVLYLYESNKLSIYYLEASYRLHPMNYNILPYLSISYAYFENNFEKAKYFLQKAEELNADKDDILFAKGVIELKRGDIQNARLYFEKLPFYSDIEKVIDNPDKEFQTRYSLRIQIIKNLLRH